MDQLDPWHYVDENGKTHYDPRRWDFRYREFRNADSDHLATEIGPLMTEIGASAIDHRKTTGKELDAMITFPSGKDVSAAWIGRQLESRNYFTPDPETGITSSVTELMSTPEGLRWVEGLFGLGDGSVSMGSGDNQDTYFTDEGLEALKGSESAREFLKNLGIE